MNQKIKTRLGAAVAGGLLAAPLLGSLTPFAHDATPGADTTIAAQCDVKIDPDRGGAKAIDLHVDPDLGNGVEVCVR